VTNQVKFSGLQKTSLLDYPDKVASVLFTPGCNLRCPFCHNHKIALDPQPPFLQEGAALSILDSRKKHVDAVVISGGEPCMHRELPKFLAKLKEHGFSVKLDTNGFFPDVLEECLEHVDYVAMDVKTCQEKYWLLGASDTKNLMHSIEILKMGKVPYEFRTTVIPELLTEQDAQAIGEMIKGTKIYALQQFIAEDTMDKRYQTIKPYAPEKIEELAKIIKPYTEKIILRI
jgi:pyruvate formate lyase activating enzyme